MKSLILFDTEYTAWKGSQERNWSLPNEHKEIIQIAAYKIKDFKIIDTLNLYVKPSINKTLSPYIIKLTGITNEQLNKKGITFRKAIEKFYDFCKYYTIYSYGNDWNVIKENLELNKIVDPKWINFKKKCLNFKNYIRKNTMIDPDKYTSGTLYKAFKINKKLHTHNALDDINSLYYSLLKINNIHF